MYISAHFEQPDIGTMHELMRAYPLTAVVRCFRPGSMPTTSRCI